MSGMAYGKITPTDIDGFIDYHNQAFAFFELKLRDAQMDYGQRTALTRLVDVVTEAGKKGALFLCSHRVDNPYEDVPADRSIVRAIYQAGQWAERSGEQTLREAVDVFLGFGPHVQTYRPYEMSRPSTAVAVALSAAKCIHKPEYRVDGQCWICRNAR